MSELMEVMDDTPFFAPTTSDVISTLLGQYQQQRGYIDTIAGIASGDMGGAIQWFVDGSRDECSRIPSIERLFAAPKAIGALNSAYWQKAIALTDVFAAMPQARRDYWNAQIRGDKTVTVGTKTEQVPPLPDFTEDAVRPTINDLLAMRGQFFAERVDGIFRGLSGEHVTNCPQGFSKRMIIAYVTNNDYHATSKAGLINDLRAVIAKFMGRDEPGWNATGPIITMARKNHGQWLTLDGGALRIKCFKIGTAHLEVHPDMAWRLNQVLAGMYPRAIPAQFRSKPAKKHKEFQMMGRPLPFAVIDVIRDMRWNHALKCRTFGYADKSECAREEALRVMISIGGVMTKGGGIEFEYDAQDALNEIIASGCIPDRVSHQYFPTPEIVARAAVELACVGPDDLILEPSAGQGGIADYLPKDRTTCVEISKLHCDILRAKGFIVEQADFIEWAKTEPAFDIVILNPPYSEGRALSHLQAAAGLVKPGGRIVVVLPASFKGKDLLLGFDATWSRVFDNEFQATSISVVILCGVRL